MSTHSRIAISLQDDKGSEYFKYIYCHWDGYLSGVGETLLHHYNSKEKALALIELGNLSALYESIECPEGHTFDNRIKGYTIAYGRDRQEDKQQARKADSLRGCLTAEGRDWEYFYLWDSLTEKWYYILGGYVGNLKRNHIIPQELTEESIKK